MARSRDWEAFAASAGSKTEPKFTLTDEQWSLIADLLPEPEQSPEGGRPPAPSRACFEGICWVLQTGARWKDLPTSFPSASTCWRRLRDWTNSGAWEQAWSRLLRRLDRAGAVDTSEAMADGTFCSAKKGALAWARPSAAKAPRSWCSPQRMVCHGARTLPAPVLTK